MVLPGLSASVCSSDAVTGRASGGAVVQCSFSVGGRSPWAPLGVRCSLSVPGRRPLAVSLPGSARVGGAWLGQAGAPALAFTRGAVAACSSAWSSVLANQRIWSERSLRSLARVSTMLRSTSIDCIAALGGASSPGVAGAAKPARGGAGGADGGGPPRRGDDGGDEAALRASLSRFITTASRAEVAAAAMLSDLSNMAYDVAAISAPALAATHNLTVVRRSRDAAPAGAAPPVLPAPRAAPAPGRQQQQQPAPAPAERAAPAGPSGRAARAPAWDAAPAYAAFGSANGSAPASPRTPFVLASFSELEDALASGEAQLATAAGPVGSPGTPRRLSSALAAAAPPASPRAAAAATADAPAAAAQLSGAPSAGTALAAQLLAFQQADLSDGAAAAGYRSSGAAAAAAELAQAQAEQALLLELAQAQQLQALLQREHALMSALQEQAGDAPAGWAAAPAPGAPDAAPAAPEASQAPPPADWFVADGPADAEGGAVRYVVIQGSISLEHWRINLTIDPCEFEGGALGGVKVHRGVYEAALRMLPTFVPLVREHLAAHPGGRIAFTGHSLGGSLATLLMLLLVHRGVLPASAVATVRTFGAPAIFCEGAAACPPSAGACQSCSLPCEHRAERAPASAAAGAAAAGGAPSGGGLLSALGLAPEVVANVVMTRDIVPRAFVCDYTLVAGMLKSWLPSFKEHVGLAACRDHKALYNFVGTVEVLQPSPDCSFVLGDERHAMLPPQAALYKLTEPSCALPAPGAGARAEPAPAPCAASPRGSSCGGGSCAGGSCAGGSCAGGSCAGGSCGGCAASGGGAGPEPAPGARKARGRLSGFPGLGSLGNLAGFGSFGSLAALGSMGSLTSAIADLTSTFTLTSSGGSGPLVSVPVSAAEAASEAAAPPAADAPGEGAPGCAGGGGGLTLGDAILTFMNSPHPLETLGELRAYGPAGAISRFHNPNSYTIALNSLSR
ncbi:PLIP1 [Scenedesmus sp. PABB004]|nr:PLIP1 [Scenedesmus sp. PABB004]